MAENNVDVIPVVAVRRKSRNERTEAKFFEDADKLIAQISSLGAAYVPPNPIAALDFLQAKRAEAATLRSTDQAANAVEEERRNERERLFKPLNTEISGLVAYAKSAGKELNSVAALQSIARDIRGSRAGRITPVNPLTAGGESPRNISVSQLSYASRTDAFARFVEQYDALKIATKEDQYQVSTQRNRLTGMRDANAAVIASEAVSATTGQAFDTIAYTAEDSLLNGCISAKAYLKSKYTASGEPYRSISGTRFRKPSRLR